MSVKAEMRPRTKSNFGYSSDLSSSIESPQHYERRLIETCGLHLSGFCTINDKAIIDNEKSLSTDNLCKQQYFIQIEGQNLYITKSQVKHTFSLEKFLLESGQFLRFQFCEFWQFIITNCTLANRSTKFLLVSDSNELSKNSANCVSIKPISLIQQNEKLRMSKLNKSVSKSFSIVSQCNGKLNFEWGKQNTDSIDNVCLKSSVKFQNRTSSLSIKNDIKPSNSKKIEKKIRQHPKDLNKSMGNFNETMKGSIYQQKNRSFLNSTNKSKLINCSFVEPKRQKSKTKLLESSIKQRQPIRDELLNCSLKTQKKDMKKQMEVPVRVGANKAFNTVNKQNKYSDNSLNSNSIKKPTYTQFKSSLLNNVNLSTSIRMGPKTFGKNISQAKIAQVSRPLLQLKE